MMFMQAVRSLACPTDAMETLQDTCDFYLEFEGSTAEGTVVASDSTETGGAVDLCQASSNGILASRSVLLLRPTCATSGARKF